MIDLQSAVFIMDGPSDIKAFQGKLLKDFGEQPAFRKAPTNGHTVSPDGYVNGVMGIVTFALNDVYKDILCILDRERRTISANRLAIDIKSLLIARIMESSKFKQEELETKIKVVVADRMLENWIVADVEGIKSKEQIIKQNIQQKNYDGQSGSNILKTFMLTNYNKVRDAPILFKAVSNVRAMENSHSFKSFLSAIGSI